MTPASEHTEAVEALLHENRHFPPSAAFAAAATTDASIYAEASRDPEAWWAEQARTLAWERPFTTTLEWEVPFARWFADGTLNASVSCVDRHVAAGRGDKVALHWVGEPEGDRVDITYADLLVRISQAAHALTALGVRTGDRVAIYLPMIPEAVVAMLACARIGATHMVIFGGFAPDAIADRVLDADARFVVTADGGYRRGAAAALKPQVDDALRRCPEVAAVLVVRRTGQEVTWVEGRDHWWHELVEAQPERHEAEAFPAEHPLFIMYTSGTTARPKGIVHSTGGYLTQAATTHRIVFDIKADTDICWTSADVGWITGHSYVVYGPLSCGATVLMYEGAPNHPEPDRFWDIIDRHGVTIFYTAPTAIRAFMRWGDDYVKKHSLKSLRLLGSVGEPINPEAWMWYHTLIGKKRCPIVDTWWQTETGCIMVTPLPGITATTPGSCTLPFFGVVPKILDEQGHEVPRGGGGKLFLKNPWPSMLRTLWGDDERFKKQYWSELPGYYFAGDGARFDADGYLWVVGRIDDVLNVSGHRIGTAEVESALVSHPSVAEAAVVGRPDELKGQALVCFVTLKNNFTAAPELKEQLRAHVAKEIGSLARPDDVRFAAGLPKTRSGKIMRRILKEIAAGGIVKGDTTTLEDFNVVAALQAQEE